MSLLPGTRIGAYDIVSLLGTGGMGEVYRATDTKLKREVAIKILPAALADDRDRLARFQREAEVLASLNHPNIAGIYGIEETHGSQALPRRGATSEEVLLSLRQLQSGYDLGFRVGLTYSFGSLFNNVVNPRLGA